MAVACGLRGSDCGLSETCMASGADSSRKRSSSCASCVEVCEVAPKCSGKAGELGQFVAHARVLAPQTAHGEQERNASQRRDPGPHPICGAALFRPRAQTRRAVRRQWRASGAPCFAPAGLDPRSKAPAIRDRRAAPALRDGTTRTSPGAARTPGVRCQSARSARRARGRRRIVRASSCCRLQLAKRARNSCSPLRMRVLIVPKGSPVFSAISVCVNP